MQDTAVRGIGGDTTVLANRNRRACQVTRITRGSLLFVKQIARHDKKEPEENFWGSRTWIYSNNWYCTVHEFRTNINDPPVQMIEVNTHHCFGPLTLDSRQLTPGATGTAIEPCLLEFWAVQHCNNSSLSRTAFLLIAQINPNRVMGYGSKERTTFLRANRLLLHGPAGSAVRRRSSGVRRPGRPFTLRYRI